MLHRLTCSGITVCCPGLPTKQRQVPFISPDVPGCWFSTSWAFTCGALWSSGSFSIYTRSDQGNYEIPSPPMPAVHRPYCSLPLGHSWWGEHCLLDISLIKWVIWDFDALPHCTSRACDGYKKRMGKWPRMSNLYGDLSKLQTLKKGYSRADGDLPGFWCLPLTQILSGVAQDNSQHRAQPLAACFGWPIWLSCRQYY